MTLTVNGAADPWSACQRCGRRRVLDLRDDHCPGAWRWYQFNGLTANIPVGSLATGTYTVSARIRDAAGNWSTGTNGIRSAT